LLAVRVLRLKQESFAGWQRLEKREQQMKAVSPLMLAGPLVQ